MREYFLLIATFIGLTGCVPNIREAQLENIPLAQLPTIPETESACIAAGQHWFAQGLPGGRKSCAVKTTDDRKICTDSSQCQGDCLVENSLPIGSKAIGSCSEWVGNFGCFKFIENGRVQQICAH